MSGPDLSGFSEEQRHLARSAWMAATAHFTGLTALTANGMSQEQAAKHEQELIDSFPSLVVHLFESRKA